MRLQIAYKTRVEEFVRLLKKGKGIEYARLNASIGTRISRAAASLRMTNNGKPTKYLKSLRDEDAAILLINESTRLRILYEKINHEKTIELSEGLFINTPPSTAKAKALNAFNELKSKCASNVWVRLHGGLKQLAEKHGTSADELKRVGNILTNGMRGEHARIFFPDQKEVTPQMLREAANKMTFRLPSDLVTAAPVTTPTIDECIEVLKSKGYRVMKPVSEWVEI